MTLYNEYLQLHFHLHLHLRIFSSGIWQNKWRISRDEIIFLHPNERGRIIVAKYQTTDRALANTFWWKSILTAAIVRATELFIFPHPSFQI